MEFKSWLFCLFCLLPRNNNQHQQHVVLCHSLFSTNHKLSQDRFTKTKTHARYFSVCSSLQQTLQHATIREQSKESEATIPISRCVDADFSMYGHKLIVHDSDSHLTSLLTPSTLKAYQLHTVMAENFPVRKGKNIHDFVGFWVGERCNCRNKLAKTCVHKGDQWPTGRKVSPLKFFMFCFRMKCPSESSDQKA